MFGKYNFFYGESFAHSGIQVNFQFKIMRNIIQPDTRLNIIKRKIWTKLKSIVILRLKSWG